MTLTAISFEIHKVALPAAALLITLFVLIAFLVGAVPG